MPMTPALSFAKMHGLGNDFIVLESISQPLPSLSPAAVRHLADRRRGIGFDQLLLLQPAETPGSDFFYRILNADGGEVGQCGNGARCAHLFLRRRGLAAADRLRLRTITTAISTRLLSDSRARAAVPPPQFLGRRQAAGHVFEHITLGNPHYVCFADAPVSADELSRLGAELNSTISGGVNVGFAVTDREGIRLQVYERGAGLTAACGSGALAAAAAAIQAGRAPNPARVTMPGGALLCGAEADGSVWMEGEIAHVFDGTLSPHSLPQ